MAFMRTDAVAIVTGGAGFVGSNLIDRLIGDGYRVICIDNFQTGSAENVGPFGLLTDHSVIGTVAESSVVCDLLRLLGVEA